MVQGAPEEDSGFTEGQAGSGNPKRFQLYWRPDWIKELKVSKTQAETTYWTRRLSHQNA